MAESMRETSVENRMRPPCSPSSNNSRPVTNNSRSRAGAVRTLNLGGGGRQDRIAADQECPLSRSLLRGDRFANWREPAEAVRRFPFHDREELPLQPLSHRPALSLADHDAVNRTYGRDLGRRPREEHFVGNVQHLARHRRFHQLYAQTARKLNNRVARNSRKNRSAERRRGDPAIAHHKNILARSFADIARVV